MNPTYADQIAREMGVQPRQVAAVITLLTEGATIPFMARYRKEAHGSLDEVQLAAIRDRAEHLQQLDDRKAAILKSLEERNLLTDALKAAVQGALTLTALEDIYLPYRPKRRTRATIAREKGLEPLADLLWAQDTSLNPEQAAQAFISQEKEVHSVEDALQGARDILAERVSEDREAREKMRRLYLQEALVSAKVIKGKEEEAAKYRDYFEWNEPIKDIPSHRLLALRRGEKELFLSVNIRPETERAIEILNKQFVKGRGPASAEVEKAVEDSYDRLLGPSIETEARILTKDKADEEAIRVFVQNLRELLLAAPLGRKRVLGVDPGFRTGCKLVCLDEQGNLLENSTMYPHPPQHHTAQATAILHDLVARHRIEVIAVGNGTAGRETEAFVRDSGLPKEIQVVMVNESGASIYSASDVARAEFPDYDLTVRGAVSIGRRLMDPLAELVKIDPKSIGVGQYQHDVDQSLLKKSLDDTVISCVNGVGVELNTASQQLLTYVSGLGPSLAANIVKYRAENGPFRRREDLKKVARLGEKAFEQAAGFLRIRDGAHPLDASAVHPERYALVERMAKDLGATVADLLQQPELRKKIDLNRYVSAEVGLPTLKDILAELEKPGRDPRQQFEAFSFAEGVNHIGDLHEGMVLPGIVTNVTNFGAFVDIGVHQDGLVHISQISHKRIEHPGEVLKVSQRVQVKVVSVDADRKRIGLTMKLDPPPARRNDRNDRNDRRDSAPKESEHIRFSSWKKK